MSSALIPNNAKEDILCRDEKGPTAYANFVKTRLLPESQGSVWDTMKKEKIKTFSTWMDKTPVRVGDNVIKLREERQLLARFLVIQQSRPEFLPRLASTIGNYEMAVMPRSMFAGDGSLLIPNDKASIIHAVEAFKPTQPMAESLPLVPHEPLQVDALFEESQSVAEATLSTSLEEPLQTEVDPEMSYPHEETTSDGSSD